MFKNLAIKAAVGAIFGLATGMADDLRLLRTYRKREQFAEFALVVALERWFAGALYGAVTGIGIGGVESAGLLPS